MDNTTRAQLSYDAMLARGPEEAPLFDVAVDYTIHARIADGFTLAEVVKAVGGHVNFSSSTDEDGICEVTGNTDLEDVEGEEDAEEIVRNLLSKVPGVIMDDAEILVVGPDEEDYLD